MVKFPRNTSNFLSYSTTSKETNNVVIGDPGRMFDAIDCLFGLAVQCAAARLSTRTGLIS